MSYKTFEIVKGELLLGEQPKSYDKLVENHLPWMLETNDIDKDAIHNVLLDSEFASNFEPEYGSDLIDIGLDD